MLTEQKEQIHTYRLQGWGYKRIASELHVTVDQVKRYCKKNGLSGPAQFLSVNLPIWYEQNMRCRVCGKKLTQPSRGRKRHFCSGKCRTAFYRKGKQRENSEEVDLLEKLYGGCPIDPVIITMPHSEHSGS